MISFFQEIEAFNVICWRVPCECDSGVQIPVAVMWENVFGVSGEHWGYNQPAVACVLTQVSYSLCRSSAGTFKLVPHWVKVLAGKQC